MLDISFVSDDDDYGLAFRRSSDYDPFPSFSFNDNGELIIGIPDDDVAVQIRDELDRRFPVDARMKLAEDVYDRLCLLRDTARSAVRQSAPDSAKAKTRLSVIEDIMDSLSDII